ncbi:hypothetical protein APHAL10511_001493 [Amanita phalloides]|nr:hypothetical protein APHAL10511_001493 [Amanita phalloides]
MVMSKWRFSQRASLNIGSISKNMGVRHNGGRAPPLQTSVQDYVTQQINSSLLHSDSTTTLNYLPSIEAICSSMQTVRRSVRLSPQEEQRLDQSKPSKGQNTWPTLNLQQPTRRNPFQLYMSNRPGLCLSDLIDVSETSDPMDGRKLVYTVILRDTLDRTHLMNVELTGGRPSTKRKLLATAIEREDDNSPMLHEVSRRD